MLLGRDFWTWISPRKQRKAAKENRDPKQEFSAAAAARETLRVGGPPAGDRGPPAEDESPGARGRTVDLRVQLLPDTSSRWSKGPSAPVRGQLVLQGCPPRPRLEAQESLGPTHPADVTFEVQLQAAPCPPLHADSASGQQGLPAAPVTLSAPAALGRGLDTYCWRLLTVSLPF